MLKHLSRLGFVAAMMLVGITACTGGETSEQYQRQIMISNDVDVSVAPFLVAFDSGAGVLMDSDDDGHLVVCVLAQGGGDCVFTHEAPGIIGAVEQVPHCLDGTVALSFEVIRDEELPVTVYYSDGAATLDRNQAQSWFEEVRGCELRNN